MPLFLPAVPTGAILMYGSTTPPDGYLNCDGNAVSRATYAALFALVGITFGPGNGTTTFDLPDLRGRFPFGDDGVRVVGDTGGSFDHDHTGPSHTHTGPSHTHTGPSHDHSGVTGTYTAVSAVAGSGNVRATTHNHTISADGTANTGSGGTGATGADGTGATGVNNPPYQVVNFIIKT